MHAPGRVFEVLVSQKLLKNLSLQFSKKEIIYSIPQTWSFFNSLKTSL